MRRVFSAMQAYSIEVFLALLCFLAGLPILLNPVVFAPASVLALFPLPFVLLWAVALTLGGLLDLTGIMFENIYLRMAGLALLSAGAVIMGSGVFVLTGFTRLLSTGIYFIFAWATGTRYHQLSKVRKDRRKRWERKAREM